MPRHAPSRMAPGLPLLLPAPLALILGLSGLGAEPERAGMRAADFEASITAELETRSPQAADAFRRANAAREQGDMERASSLYARTVELAPGFYHANRRRCWAEAVLGHREEAIRLCLAALDASDSAYNHTAMAFALSYDGSGDGPGEVAMRNALGHALAAADRKPDDDMVQFVLCEVAYKLGETAIMAECAAALQRIAPGDPEGFLYASLRSALSGDLRGAGRLLEEARRRGLAEETYADIHAAYGEATPEWGAWIPAALKVGGGWLAGFALLLGVGSLLSAATLRSVKRLPARPSRESQRRSVPLRRTYRVVLWLCCAYYYVSIPLVLLTVGLAGWAVIFGPLGTGSVSGRLKVLAGLVVLGTLWSVVKSLVARSRDEDPGPEIDVNDHPRLKGALEEVARRVGTPMVNHVYLTPGVEVAVFERGGMFRQMGGAARRCLILGVGALPDLKVSHLKAILAHEYGHLSNEDTAGGGFALAVRRSMVRMAMGLAESGAAAWYNPAWWFVNGFYRIFLRISHGASRLQEIMADRWAVACYGPTAFVEGLRTIIASGVRFDIKARDLIEESLRKARPLVNIYAASPEKELDKIFVAGEIEEAINAEPSPYASHPSPSERFELARSLAVEDPTLAPGEDEGAWSLFERREALERRMTELVKSRVVDEQGRRVLA